MSQNYDFTFKILLLGAGAVGKTALVHRFVHDAFSSQYLMTIGMEPYSRYETINGTKIVYSLWDIAGQDRFKVMRAMFFRGAMGALVVFDLTRKESFEKADEWVQESMNESPDLKFILVGNKNDLVDQRVISREQGEAKANALGAIGYIETSALSGDKVPEAFRNIGKKLLKDRKR